MIRKRPIPKRPPFLSPKKRSQVSPIARRGALKIDVPGAARQARNAPCASPLCPIRSRPAAADRAQLRSGWLSSDRSGQLRSAEAGSAGSKIGTRFASALATWPLVKPSIFARIEFLSFTGRGVAGGIRPRFNGANSEDDICSVVVAGARGARVQQVRLRRAHGRAWSASDRVPRT
jgi:hypothetical protein